MRSVKLTLMALLVAAPLHAQGWIDVVPGPHGTGRLEKVRTEVNVRVSDRVARVEVTEWFRNIGTGLGEGNYLYPLPGEAVFSDFSLFQGEQELRGETMSAEKARRIYEEIVRRRKDPALIELVGHGLVRARVFPINPGETRKITLRYTQVLKRSGDALQFRYAAGGAYTPMRSVEMGEGTGAHRPGPAAVSFRMVVENAARYRAAFSPTHELRVSRADGRMTVRPVGSLSGDLVVFLPLAERAIGLTLATHRPAGEDGYFMLTLTPGETAGAVLPRDVTVVVDVSGSMSGEKIEQARSALRQLLGTLGRNDRFRLISFSSGVTTFRADWSRTTPNSLADARHWVDGLRAEGGTNIAGALREAFRASSPDSRIPFVIFMTDGLPSVGEQNPERIAEQAEQERGRTRVFAFGVGYDVNTYLLDRLTAAGRGSTQYVQPGEDVEQALGTLATKIQHPVLADLTLGGSPVELTEIYPERLPDLFAGEDLVIFGRYRIGRTDRQGSLAVSGRRNGRTERYATAARFPVHEVDNDFIPRLWASRKIGALGRRIHLEGQNPELVEELRRTALRYGLLSEYTSYLVQEPMLAGNVLRADRALPSAATPRAASVSGEAAVRQAMERRRALDVSSVAQLEAAQKVAARPVDTRSTTATSTRTIAGRTFALDGGVWRDAGYHEGGKVVRIAPFSAAYFALLRALPELEPYWAALSPVLVSGAEVSVEIADDGATGLSAAELSRIVKTFRGK